MTNSALVKNIAPHGVRVSGGAAVLRERIEGAVVLMSLIGGASADVTIHTAQAHPTHSAFVFIDVGGSASTDPRPGRRAAAEVRSVFELAPAGATRQLRLRGHWQVTVALIPRRTLATMTPALPKHTRTYSDRHILDRAMQRFVEELLSVESERPRIERYAVEQLTLEMSAGVLLDRMSSLTTGTSRSDLRRRAMALITQQRGDQDLTSERVARLIQCPHRTLQDAFAEVGKGVAAEIRRQRARLAHSLLIDSRYDTLSIDEIAARAGFGTTTSLRRAFADEYGASPSAVRRSRSS